MTDNETPSPLREPMRHNAAAESVQATSRQHKYIEDNRKYAFAIASELAPGLTVPADREELFSAAEFGLVQAAETFDESRGVTFATFAYYRIRGAALDFMRRSGRVNKFEVAANEYMADQTGGGVPRNFDPDSQTRTLTAGVATCYILANDREAGVAEPHSANPEQCVLSNERRQLLKDALVSLPARNRQVIEDYYFNDLSFDAIAERMGLSKSWVSRIHARSIDLIRETCQARFRGSSVIA